jgi:hypothetical protein
MFTEALFCVLKNVGVNQKGINKKLYTLKSITDGNKQTKEHSIKNERM